MNIHIALDTSGSRIMAASANQQGAVIQRFRQMALPLHDSQSRQGRLNIAHQFTGGKKGLPQVKTVPPGTFEISMSFSRP